jgi:ABC-type uncharacterized transport system involved in gliding motility auxiliary subunit
MIVVGNYAFLTNEGLRVSEAGLDFSINAINWLINREHLAGIAPKSKQVVRLSLNEKQMGRIALAVIGIIPSIVALLGALAWWRRRA